MLDGRNRFEGVFQNCTNVYCWPYCPSILGLLDYDDKIKERLANLQKDHERQGDDLLREQTLRKSELAKIKIDNLESKLDQGI